MKTLQRICIMCTVALTVAVMLYWWLHFHWDGGPAIQPPPRIGSQALGEPKPAGGPIETPTPEPPRPHGRDKPAPAQEQAFMAAFQTPISFWGKVIDEKGNEIPDVAVELVANDEPYGKGAKYQRNTDSSGLFSIGGIHGMSLHVRVSKDGYYQTAESQKSTIYATRGTSDQAVPTLEKPAIFRLRRKGDTARLVHRSERLVKLPKNGAPVVINLVTGEQVAAGRGHLQVECWTEDEKRDEKGHYPWRCRVSALGGGLIDRVGESDFTAPLDGYKPHDDITSPASGWSSEAARDYFVMIAGDRYARVKLALQTRGDHFLVIESYFNPKLGDRNLEFDPSKEATGTSVPE